MIKGPRRVLPPTSPIFRVGPLSLTLPWHRRGTGVVQRAAALLALLVVFSPGILVSADTPSSALFLGPPASSAAAPPELPLGDEWRRYVVGPSGRDVAPKQVVRAEGVQDPEAMLASDGRSATMSPGSSVVIDFGQVVSGKVELAVANGGSTTLSLSFSESLRFLNVGSDEARYGLGDLTYSPPTPPSTWTSPYRRTFRYLLVRSSGPVAIDAVRLYFTPPLWPTTSPSGLFLSDDDQLNRLWYHGVYTLQLVTASGTATDADGTWEPVRGRLDVAASSWRSLGVVKQGDSWSDYAFRFNLALAPGSPAAGWVFRATAAGHYLWELLQPISGPAQLLRWKTKDGQYQQLGVTQLNRPIAPDQRVAVSVEVAGSTIVTRLDGVVVDTTVDSTFDHGTIGFRAAGAQHFYVDSLQVTSQSGVLFADDFSGPSLDPARWTAAEPTMLLDGAKRDRALGTADLAIAARTYYLAGGDPRIVRDILTTLAQYQSPSGKIPGGIYGPNPPNAESEDLKDYTLWWILVLRDYVLQTGDLATLRDLAPNLDRVLAWAAAQARPDGLLDKGSGLDWYWTWPTRGGTTTYLNALYVGSLGAAADLYGWLGRDAGPLRSQAEQVSATINRVLWDPAAGAYVDSDSLRSAHPLDGTALAVYFGVADKARADSALAYLRRTLWTQWGSRTSDQPIPSQYHNGTIWPALVQYEVGARFADGDIAGAYDLMRRTWGNMLNVDPASTFWEFASGDGQPYDGFDSLAHGWSTGPVSLLTRHALGVRPLEPGYATALVAPQPGPLHQAEGRVPTPLGTLDVSWHQDGSTFSLSVAVPAGMKVIVGVPAGTSLQCDGQAASAEAQPASISSGLDPTPRQFLTVGPGVHTIASEAQPQ